MRQKTPHTHIHKTLLPLPLHISPFEKRKRSMKENTGIPAICSSPTQKEKRADEGRCRCRNKMRGQILGLMLIPNIDSLYTLSHTQKRKRVRKK